MPSKSSRHNCKQANRLWFAQHVMRYRCSDSKRHVTSLETLLDHDDLQIRRAAAEALGRVGDSDSRAKLIDALERVEADRHLEHSLLYALIEISRRESQPIQVEPADSDTKLYAGLLVLDQLGQTDELEPARLFVALHSKDPKLRLTAADILAKHPEWASESIDDLRDLWSRVSAEPNAEITLSHPQELET